MVHQMGQPGAWEDIPSGSPSAKSFRNAEIDLTALAPQSSSSRSRSASSLTGLVFLMETGGVRKCPMIIDSPLATRASEIFRRHARELENGDVLVRAIEAKNVRFTETAEQS